MVNDSYFSPIHYFQGELNMCPQMMDRLAARESCRILQYFLRESHASAVKERPLRKALQR